jgi:type II secretory pathway component PulJ
MPHLRINGGSLSTLSCLFKRLFFKKPLLYPPHRQTHCRHFFTLLETLIALALTTLALSTLLFFYREIVTLNNKADEMEKESFQLRYVESKLSFIFPRTISQKNKKDFFFFTSQDPGGLFASGNPQSLVFTFDRGVNLSKQFSNLVLSQMYLDTNHRLVLATWPAPSRWAEGGHIQMKFEVLMENVDALKFWFFIAPNKKWKDKGTSSQTNPQTNPPTNPPTNKVEVVVNPSPEGGWIDHWSQDFKQLPAIIKMEIKRKGKTEFFTFPLSNCKRQPVYNQ